MSNSKFPSSSPSPKSRSLSPIGSRPSSTVTLKYDFGKLVARMEAFPQESQAIFDKWYNEQLDSKYGLSKRFANIDADDGFKRWLRENKVSVSNASSSSLASTSPTTKKTLETEGEARLSLLRDKYKELERKKHSAEFDRELKKHFGAYVAEKIYEMSDNVPSSPALNNEFFKHWTSDKILPAEKIRAILANYRALTDLTRHAVAVSFLAAHGNVQAEAKVGANLSEESGGGDHKKAHINLLDNFIHNTLSHIGAQEIGNISNSPLILKQTREAMKIEQDLYIGNFITKKGIIDTLMIGGHPLNVTAGIQAVSAAHESKASGMLIMLLEGLVKYLGAAKNTIKSGIREYFDEHLGKDVVDRIFDGEKISKTLLAENEKVKDWSSKKLRENGYIEQAHRRDANDSTIAIIMSDKTTDGHTVGFYNNVQAFLAAKSGFEIFPEAHAHFWNGVHSSIIVSRPQQALYNGSANTIGTIPVRRSNSLEHNILQQETAQDWQRMVSSQPPSRQRSPSPTTRGFVENFLRKKEESARESLREQFHTK